jgi:hypothetical protein
MPAVEGADNPDLSTHLSITSELETPWVYGTYSSLIPFSSSHPWLTPSCCRYDSPAQSSPCATRDAPDARIAGPESSSPSLTITLSTYRQADRISLRSSSVKIGWRL